MKDLNSAQELGVTYPYKPKYQEVPENIQTPVKPARWTQLDLARGIAISLMILSHCVKGLMYHSRIPDWGLVPIHVLTKFSSSLFIVIFGISLSVYFLPHVNQSSWKKKRFWMIKRGIELMIWYKILTVVQTFQFYPESMIWDLILFRTMPDFVEILCFYSIALMWLPFFLPIWSRMSFPVKAMSVVAMVSAGQWLHFNFDFWGYDSLKAILVENEGYYTFGQLQRGGIVFLGLLMGDSYKKLRGLNFSKAFFAEACFGIGSMALMYFYITNYNELSTTLVQIAKNIGKHPFSVDFFSFSLGGAFVLLGLCLLTTKKLQKFLMPLVYLGKNSMNAFILHIIIIFYFYRYYFDLFHKVTYLQSLMLTGLCIAITVVILHIWNKGKAALS